MKFQQTWLVKINFLKSCHKNQEMLGLLNHAYEKQFLNKYVGAV